MARLTEDEDSPEYQAKSLAIDRFFAENATPQNFDADAPENAVLQLEQTFETLCSILESNGVHAPHELTTLQFYARLDHFKKQAIQNKQTLKSD